MAIVWPRVDDDDLGRAEGAVGDGIGQSAQGVLVVVEVAGVLERERLRTGAGLIDDVQLAQLFGASPPDALLAGRASSSRSMSPMGSSAS